jgi:hypothetical protein
VRKGKPTLTLRELPPSGGYDVLHVQSLRGAHYLMGPLKILELQSRQRAAEMGGEHMLAHAAMHMAMERQALSEAIQIMAAMTCEAAVNLLGVLLVGESQFSTIERKPLTQKLELLLELLPPIGPEVHSKLFKNGHALMEARHSFVHPKPKEGDDVTPHAYEPSVEAAAHSIRRATAFLDGMAEIHPRYGNFFLAR